MNFVLRWLTGQNSLTLIMNLTINLYIKAAYLKLLSLELKQVLTLLLLILEVKDTDSSL